MRNVSSAQPHLRTEAGNPPSNSGLVEPIAAPNSRPKPISSGALVLSMAGVMLVLGLLMIVQRRIHRWKALQSQAAKRPPTLPCPRCRYFNPSAFLYCAVHPTVAMTQEALNCQDFQSREATPQRPRFPHNHFGG